MVLLDRDGYRETGNKWYSSGIEPNCVGARTVHYLLGHLDKRAPSVSAVQKPVLDHSCLVSHCGLLNSNVFTTAVMRYVSGEYEAESSLR